MRVAVIYAFRSPGSGAVYIGKHECDPEGWPRRGSGRLPDGYPGRGKVVQHFHRKHGAAVQWRILAIVSLDDWSRAERRVIRLARAIFGRLCVNILSGGDGMTSAEAREIQNRPAMKAAASVRSKACWTDPEFVDRAKAGSREAQNRPEVRARRSVISSILWTDPEWAEATGAAIREANNRPEVRAKKSVSHKALAQTPKRKAQLARASATNRINATWRHLARVRPELFG